MSQFDPHIGLENLIDILEFIVGADLVNFLEFSFEHFLV